MGSGRVLAGSGCVLELKNDTSKIIEIHCKKTVFWAQEAANWSENGPKNALFWNVKILRIHCKKHCLGSMSVF